MKATCFDPRGSYESEINIKHLKVADIAFYESMSQYSQKQIALILNDFTFI
jgi:hypothetical protein